jgi:endonuclease YncB( thermonuclease family)
VGIYYYQRLCICLSIANQMTIRIALLLLACLPGLALAEQFICRVMTISEGDTFSCLTTENKRLRVRLAEIDAPERKQPYGAEAKQALSELVLEKQVVLHVQEVDRYGRTLARAFVGGIDVNHTLVAQGAAWAYTKQLKDHRLKDAETLARNMGKGLWQLPAEAIVAPWDWRYAGRIAAPQKAKPSRTASFSQFGGG